MAAYNRVTLLGRVVKQPEVKPAGQSGSTVAKFRLAVGRSKKNPQTGQWEDDPNKVYIDCEAWHSPGQKMNLCDVIQKYVNQGDQVLVDGRLKMDEWEDKNGGGKRSKISITVTELQMLGGKGDGGDSGGTQSGCGQQPGVGSSPAPEDLPF